MLANNFAGNPRAHRAVGVLHRQLDLDLRAVGEGFLGGGKDLVVKMFANPGPGLSSPPPRPVFRRQGRGEKLGEIDV